MPGTRKTRTSQSRSPLAKTRGRRSLSLAALGQHSATASTLNSRRARTSGASTTSCRTSPSSSRMSFPTLYQSCCLTTTRPTITWTVETPCASTFSQSLFRLTAASVSPSSCSHCLKVNSCEAFWAVLKRRVLPRFTRLQILERADRSLFMAIVEDEAKMIDA